MAVRIGDEAPDFTAETAMERIRGGMKVAEVVRRHPETVEVFLARGCPDMRRGFFNVIARLMSVRAAARVHRLDLEALLEDLNEATRHAARGAVRPQSPSAS
jgi:hypothetical protein